MKKIKDNPSIAKSLKELDGFEGLAKLAQFAKKLGFGENELVKSLADVPHLASGIRELSLLPDRFNTHFAKLGWIAHETLDVELMRNAIGLADEGNIVQAEEMLVDYFDEENIKAILQRLKSVDCFFPRWQLANLALTDYLEGRYHASIPVVLSLIDGIVNDVLKTVGLFAASADLTAWDSIVGHDSGLTELAKILGKARTKTTTEVIMIPYRNGILHGRDLGYANRTVAAKTWAALWAVRDWAVAIQEGKKNAPPPQPEPGALETFLAAAEQLKKNQTMKEETEAWRPRTLVLGAEVPITGVPEDYQIGSPERAVAEFFFYWQKKNYGKMGALVRNPKGESFNKVADQTKKDFKDKIIQSFAIVQLEDKAPVASEVVVKLDVVIRDRHREMELRLRLLREDEAGRPVINGEDGQWRLHTMHLSSLIHAF